MAANRKQNQDIREFILDHLEKYPSTITAAVTKKFNLSRTAANGHIKRLVQEGLLEASGNTKARWYQHKLLVDETFKIQLSTGLAEDSIWRFRILPLIKAVKQNVIDICQYCFTEILNNAIDHSASPDALISYRQTYHKISMVIRDQGIGIFEKIKRDFNLADARMALLELSKGKLTSDQANHSGQGIFFTSRMVDNFYILSGALLYVRERVRDDEWLIETEIETEDKPNPEIGTAVTMEIDTNTPRTTRTVFDYYQGDDYSFKKTHVPIKIGKYPGEQLVSRSQAKRVLARFENFTKVILDFEGVETIGQAFADEIFRVFKNANPNIDLYAVRTSPEIEKMIKFVEAYDQEQRKKI